MKYNDKDKSHILWVSIFLFSKKKSFAIQQVELKDHFESFKFLIRSNSLKIKMARKFSEIRKNVQVLAALAFSLLLHFKYGLLILPITLNWTIKINLSERSQMKFLLSIWDSFPGKQKRKEILLRKQCGLKKNR